MKLFMKRAGAGTASASRIVLLPDADGDGVAGTKTAFLDGLNSPLNMDLFDNDFYVAHTDSIIRLPYVPGQIRTPTSGTKVVARLTRCLSTGLGILSMAKDQCAH